MSNTEADWSKSIVTEEEELYFSEFINEDLEEEIFGEAHDEGQKEIILKLIQKGYNDHSIIRLVAPEETPYLKETIAKLRLLHKYKNYDMEGIARRMQQAGVSEEEILEITGINPSKL